MTNSYIPIQTPAPPDDIDIEELAPTPRLEGTALTFYKDLSSFPEWYGINKLNEELTRVQNPGPLLTSEEYDKSAYKIAGVTHPGGIYTNVAKIQYANSRKHVIANDLVRNMTPGFLSSASRGVGHTLSLALALASPTAKIGGKYATSLFGGHLWPWLASKIEGSSLKLGLAKTAVGMAEGASIAAPFSLAQDANDARLGQHDGWLSFIANEGIGAGLGGFLRLGFGFNTPIINPEEARNMHDTAVEHLMGNRPAYLEPLLKNAGYRASKDYAGLESISSEASLKISNKLSELDEESSAINERIKKDFKKSKIGAEILRQPEGEEIAPRMEKLFSKHPEFWSEEEKSLADRFRSEHVRAKQPTILSKLFNAFNKSPENRLPEEHTLIEDFKKGREEDAIKSEIDKFSSQKKELQARREIQKEPRIKKKISWKISDLEKEIDKNSTRLGNIQKLSKLRENKDFEDLWKRRGSILDEKSELGEQLKANKAFQDIVGTYKEPVTKEEFQDYLDYIKSWKSDLFLDPKTYENSMEERAKIMAERPLIEDAKLAEKIEGARAKGELAAEEERELDELDRDDTVSNQIKEAVDTYVGCVEEGGQE